METLGELMAVLDTCTEPSAAGSCSMPWTG